MDVDAERVRLLSSLTMARYDPDFDSLSVLPRWAQPTLFDIGAYVQRVAALDAH